MLAIVGPSVQIGGKNDMVMVEHGKQANKLATVAAAVGRTKSARLRCFWIGKRCRTCYRETTDYADDCCKEANELADTIHITKGSQKKVANKLAVAEEKAHCQQAGHVALLF